MSLENLIIGLIATIIGLCVTVFVVCVTIAECIKLFN
jgi:hypothetical protein